MIGLNQVLLFQVRVDLGAMEMKKYSTFTKCPRLEPRHQMVSCHIQVTRLRGGFYPSAEMQSVYTIALAGWAGLSLATSLGEGKL